MTFKIQAFGYAYLVYYTVLFHSQGGYYNSLILKAWELFLGTKHISLPSPWWVGGNGVAAVVEMELSAETAGGILETMQSAEAVAYVLLFMYDTRCPEPHLDFLFWVHMVLGKFKRKKPLLVWSTNNWLVLRF